MPEISVVLPAFDAARTIGRAVDSILGQRLDDLELIVVDDGSTDGTAAVLERFGDPRLRVVRREHAGVVTAANVGTALATASLVARMDADDVSHPSRLERQRDWLRERELDAVGCRVRILDESGNPATTLRRYERWVNEETLTEKSIAALRFVELPLVNPTILARRGYFELGFRDADVPEDYDLLLRAAGRGMRIGKVDEVLFDWIDHAERLTRRDGRYSPEAFARCRREHLSSGPLCGVETVDLWGLGRTGKDWLRWLQESGFRVRHAYDPSPRRVGRTIHGVSARPLADLARADGTPLVIAVGAAGARERILARLAQLDYHPGRDAWFVA